MKKNYNSTFKNSDVNKQKVVKVLQKYNEFISIVHKPA